MAIALVSNVSAQTSNNNDITSGSIDTTGASLLVMEVAWFDSGGGSVTVSDSKTNTWTPLTLYTDGSKKLRFYYVTNPTVGTGHTFTVSGTSTFPSLGAAAFSGAHTATPYDGTESGSGSDTGNSIQPGEITPTESNCLVVAGAMWSSAIDFGGIGATGFSNLTELDRTGSGMGIVFAYQIQSTATAVNPNFTYGPNSVDTQANIAAFRAGAEGGGGTSFMGQICY